MGTVLSRSHLEGRFDQRCMKIVTRVVLLVKVVVTKSVRVEDNGKMVILYHDHFFHSKSSELRVPLNEKRKICATERGTKKD